MARVTIVLVDDHEVLRHGLRSLLEREPGYKVVGEAADGPTALDLMAQLRPDVVVVDLVLPGMSGLELLRQLQRSAPQSRLVVLSMHTDTLHIREALRAGALCYALKDAPPLEIVRAVQEAAAGRRYLCQNVDQELLASSLAHVGTSVDDPYELLTESERAVLVLAAQGETSAAIARALSLSTRTVETYRANLLHKLDIRNQTDLVRYALKRGIVALE
jgi:DNA-binding NarL/FixJ family response regulator